MGEGKSKGERAFSVAGPMVWNSLPTEFRDLSVGFDVFRRTVKTILFARYKFPISIYIYLSSPKSPLSYRIVSYRIKLLFILINNYRSGALGQRCISSPSGVWDGAPAEIEFGTLKS